MSSDLEGWALSMHTVSPNMLTLSRKPLIQYLLGDSNLHCIMMFMLLTATSLPKYKKIISKIAGISSIQSVNFIDD